MTRRLLKGFGASLAVAALISCCPPDNPILEDGDSTDTGSTGAGCPPAAISVDDLCFESMTLDNLNGVQDFAVGDFDGDAATELAVIHVEDNQRVVSIVEFLGHLATSSASVPVAGSASRLVVLPNEQAGGHDALILDGSGSGPPLSRTVYDGQQLSPPQPETIEGNPLVTAASGLQLQGRSGLYLLTITGEGPAQGSIYQRTGGTWRSTGSLSTVPGSYDRRPAVAGNLSARNGIEFAAVTGADTSPSEYDPDLHRITVYTSDPNDPVELVDVEAGVVPADLCTGDTNGDGLDEIVVAGTGSSVSILARLDAQQPAVTRVIPFDSHFGGPRVTLADFDGDSNVDLAVAAGELSITPDPLGASDAIVLPVGEVDDLAAGDFNDDGLGDLSYVRRSDGHVGILLSVR